MKKIIICMLLLAISLSGCTQLSKSNLQNPIQSDNSVANSQPSEYPTNTNSNKNDPPWIKAYYDYIVQNNFNPEVKLVDLDFDGSPELLDRQYADGSQYYDIGLSYKEGKVISFSAKEVSDFVGTYIKKDGSKFWYTRSFPYSLHSWPSACMIFSSYNYAALPDIIEDKHIEICFTDTHDDTNYSKLKVSIVKDGKNVNLTPDEYSLYKNWYTNTDNGADTLIKLPYIKELESSINITPQKQVTVDFTQYGMDMTKLKYENFREEMLKGYSNLN